MFALTCDSRTRGRVIELKPPDHHNGVDAEAHAAVVGGSGLAEVAVERLGPLVPGQEILLRSRLGPDAWR